MKTVVVTEEESDVLLLSALIGEGSNTVEFVKSGGWSAADSLARSYLVDGQHDVALVVDADSYDPRMVEERRRFLTHSLASVALRTRWQVFVIAPEIEILLFKDRYLLEELLHQSVTESDFQEGKFEPKKVLKRLLPGKSLTRFFQERLPQVDLTPLQNQKEIEHLRRFLNGTRKKVAA